MIRRLVAAVALATGVGSCACATPPTVDLYVTVTGVQNNRGHVLVAVCKRQEFLQPHCLYQARVPSRSGSVLVVVGHVPPGIYAVQAFQDMNDDGRINRNFLGLPVEPIGFSRDPAFHFGPPSFDDSDFLLGPKGGQVTVVLHDYAR
ncbi:MAG TPA: DUF2141 domain-containing protein [Acetobacteraceae bacterium]|nr:DUF2141 domain-containing protein [Acetobacteraceae bacterium]